MIRTCLFFFLSQTMLMMNSFVIKQKKRTKLLSAEKICILIVEIKTGIGSKQTLVFLLYFFTPITQAGHSRHTLRICWRTYVLMSLFFFLFNLRRYGAIYIYRVVQGCIRVFVSFSRSDEILARTSAIYCSRKIFLATRPGMRKGKMLLFFFIFSRFSYFTILSRHKQCQKLNQNPRLLPM